MWKPSSAQAAGNGFGITVLREESPRARMRYLRLRTGSLGWDPGVNVLLPEGYETSGLRYPVIHLHHGGVQDFIAWDGIYKIENLVGNQQAIVVMPDGGAGGWGCNPKIQLLGPRNYENFHMAELVPWIDANFRTIADPAARAVAGFSMGGFTALKYGAKYFGHFASVTSLSGPANIRHGIIGHYMQSTNAVESGSPIGLYGAPWDENLVRADNPIENLESFRGKRLAFYSGDGDDQPLHQEPNVRATHEQFSAELNRVGINHAFVRHAGAHGALVSENMGAELPQIVGALRRAG